MRDRRQAFTLIELLVVIAIIAVLLAVLMPSLNRAREQGKRMNCMSSLKQLALAWGLYADDHQERLVFGCTSAAAEGNAWPGRPFKCWVYYVTSTDMKARLQGIRDGGLYKYVNDPQLYKCPTGVRGEVVTYAMPDAMNGHDLSTAGEVAATSSPPLRVTKRAQIKRASDRTVFLDEGRLSSSSWTVWYSQERWWDQPTSRHGNGTNAVFADNHAGYWKWSDYRTVQVTRADFDLWQASGRMGADSTQPGNADLQMVQTACWGRLGYTPTR
jgi:prepilin-type N-terminal cleavage/methylation domain-containing protein/prepilin-type processing-associated H-X9-DG protein